MNPDFNRSGPHLWVIAVNRLDHDHLTRARLSSMAMASKKATGKDATVGEGKVSKRRVLSMFPTDIGSLTKEERNNLAFKPNSMVEVILQGLEKHGVEAGDKRKLVVEQVKAKFKEASDSTIRTQVYRGIIYLRGKSGV
jgi:hypothetical protein